MSLKTWKKEFYPKDAEEFKLDPSLSTIEAIEHSIKKWEGLLKENLKKHDVKVSCVHLQSMHAYDSLIGSLSIDGESCALCQKFELCEGCPLSNFLDEPCDESNDSPYKKFTRESNPEPMLSALKETLDYYKEHLDES